MSSLLRQPPLALYAHIPWCVRKCPYCDFNSHEAKSELPQMEYVSALLADLDQELLAHPPHPLVSIFIGGGTPSLFAPEAIERLLTGIRGRLPLAEDVEITLEANPGTVEQGKFAEFRAAGVNRLSIGIQSFNDDALQRIGRIHGRREAVRAAEAAHAAGFDNFNLDLMFGLPRQTVEEALADLRDALALEPSHLSWYQLTLEPNTLFHARPPTLPDEDLIADMQERGLDLLTAGGFERYEVSAYARPGRRARHNSNYWEFGDYLGIGAGAHGKYTTDGRVSRRWKHRHPREYQEGALAGTALAGARQLGEDDLILEFMLNALRLTDGVAEILFEQRTGIALDRIEPMLARAQEKELLERSDGHLWPTALGQRFLNDLVALFSADEAA
jgi:oxygen-independent coproporphyrinogen-3 oxidase